jgi:PKD repeat protein
MKKQLLLISGLVMAITVFGQTIPNGGFESWTTTSYVQPTYYMSSNGQNNNGITNPGNVVKTTDAYHGNYAVKLNTIATGGDTIFGFISNCSNPGSSPSPGGVPYNQKPTGMRLYYKSNIIGHDSAIMLVIFKKAGANLASYFYKIGATQSSYTLFNPVFTPSLTATPDTVIFAAASSNAFAGNGTPGNMFQIDSLSFTDVASQPALINGDFEIWQTQSNTTVNGWETGNCDQTTDKYSGSYALELQTAGPNINNNQTQPGNATTGIQTHTGTIGGYPYTQQIDTLIFYYKYLPADPNDSADVSINFKKLGIQFWGVSKLLPQASVYTEVKIPFNLTSTGTIPDTAIISMGSSKLWPPPTSYIGSDLKMDNMYFTSQELPVSNFIAPNKGCVGVPIQLTDNSSNMVTSWNWIIGGGSPPSSVLENPVVTYNTAGTHTITMNASNSFGTGTNISKTITIYVNPIVSATAPTICLGNHGLMTASGAATYTWNMGAMAASIFVTPTVTTTYSVTGTDVNGCKDSTTTVVTVLTPPIPTICMVTTDANSVYNIIYWDNSIPTSVDSFIIYREVQTGIYARIGAQIASDTSQFTDTARSIGPANGDPNAGSYRYKVQARDTCGNYGTLSPYHNTVYILNVGLGQFSWPTPYTIEGGSNPIVNYILFCDTANVNVWTNVATVAGTQTSATDPGYANHASIANWRVDATGFNCTPSARLSGNNSVMAAKVKSHSNQNNNRSAGIRQLVANNNQINVYPNPAATVLNIGFTNASASKVTVKIVSIIGAEVFNQTYNQVNTNIPLDISKYESGTYLVQITTDNLSEIKKIVKQ